MPDDIDFRHLRTLALLLEVRSLTQAAQILDVGQPTVSKALSRLRAYFGDPLLVRVGSAMQATPKALALAEPLRELLATSDSLRASTFGFDPASSDREFTVLVTEVGMLQVTPPLMQRFCTAGSRLRLRALPLDTRAFEGRLESGEADMAIGAFPKAGSALRRQHLYDDGYLGVARRNHPRLDTLHTTEGFFGEQHVAVIGATVGHAPHRGLDRVLSSRLASGQARVQVPNFIAAAFVVSRTDSVATLPARLADFIADDLGLASFRPPLDLPPIRIDQLWHERMQHDQAHRWLRATVFSLFGPVSHKDLGPPET
jgi:DNA-binding transcriptional LysR family regulator